MEDALNVDPGRFCQCGHVTVNWRRRKASGIDMPPRVGRPRQRRNRNGENRYIRHSSAHHERNISVSSNQPIAEFP